MQNAQYWMTENVSKTFYLIAGDRFRNQNPEFTYRAIIDLTMSQTYLLWASSTDSTALWKRPCLGSYIITSSAQTQSAHLIFKGTNLEEHDNGGFSHPK